NIYTVVIAIGMVIHVNPVDQYIFTIQVMLVPHPRIAHADTLHSDTFTGNEKDIARPSIQVASKQGRIRPLRSSVAINRTLAGDSDILGLQGIHKCKPTSFVF